MRTRRIPPCVKKKCGALSAVHKHAVVTIVDKCIKTMFLVLALAGSWVLAWANLSSFSQAPARAPVLRAMASPWTAPWISTTPSAATATAPAPAFCCRPVAIPTPDPVATVTVTPEERSDFKRELDRRAVQLVWDRNWFTARTFKTFNTVVTPKSSHFRQELERREVHYESDMYWYTAELFSQLNWYRSHINVPQGQESQVTQGQPQPQPWSRRFKSTTVQPEPVPVPVQDFRNHRWRRRRDRSSSRMSIASCGV